MLKRLQSNPSSDNTEQEISLFQLPLNEAGQLPLTLQELESPLY